MTHAQILFSKKYRLYSDLDFIRQKKHKNICTYKNVAFFLRKICKYQKKRVSLQRKHKSFNSFIT